MSALFASVRSVCYGDHSRRPVTTATRGDSLAGESRFGVSIPRPGRALGPLLLDQAGQAAELISIRYLSRLERTPTTAPPAGTAQALAAALGVPVDALNPEGARQDDRGLSEFLTSADFHQEVFGWADRHGQDPPAVAAKAKKRLRSVRFRGAGHGSTEEWLALLRSILDQLD